MNVAYSILYFSVSTVITAWFVLGSTLYVSRRQMILSIGIAGAKWMIQILLGLIAFGDQRWVFVRNISWVCLVGSVILLPYSIAAVIGRPGPEFFIASLLIAVMVMIVLYRRAVKNSEVTINAWYFWLICLIVAISLQLTVVFAVIRV